MGHIHSLVSMIVLSISLVACQSLSTIPEALNDFSMRKVPSSADSTVGLPSCSGVLLSAKLVLTRSNCLVSASKRGYIVLGQDREHPIRKLVQVAHSQKLDDQLGLLLLEENVPKPYKPLHIAATRPILEKGQSLWINTYAPEGDIRSFGQVTQQRRSLAQQEQAWLSTEGPCVAEGSPLIVRHNARWVLLGLAPSQEECQAQGGKALFHTVTMSPERIEALALFAQNPQGKGPAQTETFRLTQEIRVDQAPYQAQISFQGHQQAKTCEYSLRVIRHNSYFETRYDLKSQAVVPDSQAEARLIFEDIYASLSSLIGRVKQVEISSANCRSV